MELSIDWNTLRTTALDLFEVWGPLFLPLPLTILGVMLGVTIVGTVVRWVSEATGYSPRSFHAPSPSANRIVAMPLPPAPVVVEEPEDDLHDPYDLNHADECDYCSAPFENTRPFRCPYCWRVNKSE